MFKCLPTIDEIIHSLLRFAVHLLLKIYIYRLTQMLAAQQVGD